MDEFFPFNSATGIEEMGTKDVKELQGNRRAQRYPTKFWATVISDRRPVMVELSDISRVGACVKGSDLPTRGDEVVLTAHGLEIVATVIWTTDDACGLNFHKPVEPLGVVRDNLVRHHVRRAATRQPEAPRLCA